MMIERECRKRIYQYHIKMSAAVIFSAFNAVTSIAGYLGIIESVGGNVKKLLNQSFKSAVHNLEYATTASERERQDYIKRAREKFIDAIAVEENENLISSLLGLSMCQHLLNDTVNAQKTFDRIKDVKLTTPEKVQTRAKEIGINILLSAVSVPTPVSMYQERIEAFEKYKQTALSTK